MNRWRRAASSGLVVVMTVGVGLVVTASPALAEGNKLWVGKIDQPRGTFGANAAVRIWGSLKVKTSGCDKGVNDFVYPTSDVYLVRPGTVEGSELTDVTSGSPNTIVQYAKDLFADEVIGITAPAGALQTGVYDVVFDTCQDKVFQTADDTVFPGAVTVQIPAELPAVDEALTDLKSAAHNEYTSWRNTQRVVNGVWKLVEKALKNGCRAGNPAACALKYGNYFSPIQEQFDGLLINQGQHYLGIYEDPPNPDFDQPVVPERVNAATDAVAGEAALVQALLRAVEAYKGAQQAGDEEWALVHARTVRDLHVALAAQLEATSAQLTALAALYTDELNGKFAAVWAEARRVRDTGLTAQERRELRELGLTAAQIAELETEFGAVSGNYEPSHVRAALQAPVAAHRTTTAKLQTSLTGWRSIVARLEAGAAAPNRHPQVSAGDSYRTEEGTPVTVAATALPPGTDDAGWSYRWDLDGDRDFDDATGKSPAVVFAEPGSPVIGVRVADGAGRVGYAWANVTVTVKGAYPVIGAHDPVSDRMTVRTGATQRFEVGATDDGGAPEVRWSVDGRDVGTGAVLSWTAPPAPGMYQVVANVTDGDGHRVSQAWDVAVHRPDGDADGWTETTDCADTDPLVHPGQIEYLGNGVNDDCDSGSPDAPPGGLTGKPYGWGGNATGAVGNGVIGPDRDTPVETVLAGSVVQLELAMNTGFAVLADGTVQSWGGSSQGILGSGAGGGNRPVPGPVVGPEGTGMLGGVVNMDAYGNTAAAVQTEGTVMTWGDNTNGQLGDGTTGGSRNRPVQVLARANTPLTGVRDVEAAFGAVYALMRDGTVMGWGDVRCLGTASEQNVYAKTIPGLTEIRQIAGAGSVILFLRKDGTVLSCGATDAILGRPYKLGTPTSPYVPSPVNDLGPGSTVVDISVSTDSAAALKSDGSLLMWGENTNHELDPILPPGHNTRTPTLVPLPPGPPAVGVDHDGSTNTLLVRADGSLLAWGSNMNGGTGTGGTQPVDKPKKVELPGRVVLHAVASTYNGLALTRPAGDPELDVPTSWVSPSVADATFDEDSGDDAFTVTLPYPLAADIELSWELRADTAGADDVRLTTGTVPVPAGQTSVTVSVVLVDDVLDEDNETVTFVLSGPRASADNRASGTIVDNDGPPTISVLSTSVVEGERTSLTDTPVTFELNPPSGKEVSVTYSTASGSETGWATAGTDYVGARATVRFAPGETRKVVHLAVIGDSEFEPDEKFTVGLSDAVNATAAGPATVTITRDEVLTVSASAPTIAEGTRGEFVVTVKPAPPAGVTVTVPWELFEPEYGPGDADGDIVADSGVLTLAGDQMSGKIIVTPVDDRTVEGSEPFQVRFKDLTATGGHRVERGVVGSAWITDNDTANAPPVVDAGAGVSTVEGAAATLVGTVTDDKPGVTARWTVAGPCTVTGDGIPASVTCRDNGTFAATLTATDAGGESIADVTTVTVANAAPKLGDVVVDAAGARIAFVDPGTDDTHTCRVRWGDRTPDGSLAGALSPCVLQHAYRPGTYTATVTVTDKDGGMVSATRTVKVTSTTWPFHGFLHPVRNPPAVNRVKAGKPVPVKFKLGGYRGTNIFAPGSPTSRPSGCACGRTADIAQDAAVTGSTLSYDARTDTYTYTWATDRAWAGQCRRLVVALADGTQHWAEFQFH